MVPALADVSAGAVAFDAERPEDAAILSFPGRETPILQYGVEAV